jgi:hypothetical protein
MPQGAAGRLAEKRLAPRKNAWHLVTGHLAEKRLAPS